MVAFNSDDTKNEDYSSSEEDEETAQEKRLRLAKKYIEDLKKEGMLCSKIVCVWFYFYKIRCRKFTLYMWYWTKKHIIYKCTNFIQLICLENLRGPRSTVFKACFISWILKEHFLFHTLIIHARLILEDSNWKYTNGL